MILKVLSRLYEGGVRLRWMLYGRNVLKSQRLENPVISVGNLTVGGTGKTPFVAMLAHYLRSQSFSPVVLSRGYRGRRDRDPLLVSDGEGILTTPDAAGDEPFLLASELKGVPVVVGKDRVAAAKLIPVDENTIFLLDDGFQHLALERDIDLLLVDATAPFEEDRPFPAGRLREPFDAIKRADAIVVTRAHLNQTAAGSIERSLQIWSPGAPVFQCRTLSKGLKLLGSDREYSVDSVRDRRFVAFAGIGNPKAFVEDLKQAGVKVVRSFFFRDHHQFQQNELERALRACADLDAEGIITTTKDAIRLHNLVFPPDRIFLFRTCTAMFDEEAFFTWMDERLRSIDLMASTYSSQTAEPTG